MSSGDKEKKLHRATLLTFFPHHQQKRAFRRFNNNSNYKLCFSVLCAWSIISSLGLFWFLFGVKKFQSECQQCRVWNSAKTRNAIKEWKRFDMNALVTWHLNSLILTPTEFKNTWQLRLRYHFDQEFVSIWSSICLPYHFVPGLLS